MKRFPHSVCLALVVLALLGISRPVLAEERPFQLQRGTINPSLFPSIFGTDARVSIFGEITGLGRTSGGSGVLDFFYHGDAFDAIGTIGFTAANGDRLYATFVGSGILDLNGYIGALEGTLTFVGGTGRFADASGSADLIFLNDPLTGEHLSSIEGSIDY